MGNNLFRILSYLRHFSFNISVNIDHHSHSCAPLVLSRWEIQLLVPPVALVCSAELVCVWSALLDTSVKIHHCHPRLVEVDILHLLVAQSVTNVLPVRISYLQDMFNCEHLI